MNFKFIKLFLILFIIYIILNKHFFYNFTFVNIKLYIWFYNHVNKDIIEEYKFVNKHSIIKYFNKLENNKIHHEFTPGFDKMLYYKKYDPNMNNFNLYGKKNSLNIKLNSITTPINYLGKWIGDSIFRIDYQDRGKNNFLKEEYLKALTTDSLKIYRIMIRNYLEENININTEYNLYNLGHKITIDLLYLLHFSELPKKDEYDDIMTFINAVAGSVLSLGFNYSNLKQLYNLKYFYTKTIKRIKKLENKNLVNIISIWLKKTTLKKNDIFIEFIHNIIGLTVNWFNLLNNYLLGISNNSIPKLIIGNINNDNDYMKKYILESFRYICPVQLILSKLKIPNNLGITNNNVSVVHDLKVPTRMINFFGNNPNEFDINRMDNYQDYMSINNKPKCPFHNTKNNAKVTKGQSIYENEGYTVFGKGYRRCPGEALSMIFLEELSMFISNKDVNIFNNDNNNSKTHYIWDNLDKNIIIHFSMI